MRIRDRKENTKAHCGGEKKNCIYISKTWSKLSLQNMNAQLFNAKTIILFPNKPSEENRTEKDKYHMLLLVCGTY